MNATQLVSLLAFLKLIVKQHSIEGFHSIISFFRHCAWSWRTRSTQNCGSRIFLGKVPLARQQLKMSQFLHLSLLKRFSCDWLISFLFDILHEVEGSWEYFVICTQNWCSRFFFKNFLFVQKRAKKAQNDLIFICFPIMEAFFSH